MRDFRNIPASALCALVKNKVLAEGFMRNHSPLSQENFEYLWNVHVLNDDSPVSILGDAARLLSSRPLTTQQRATVLAADTDSDTLQQLLEYNDVPASEIATMRLHDFTSSLSAMLVSRYETSDAVMSHVMTSLSDDTFVLATLRSSPKVVSDKKVLDIVVTPLFKECIAADADPTTATDALRDLIEIRPHLILELLRRTDDPLVHAAVAQSHFVTDPAVLTAILGRRASRVTKRALRKLNLRVRHALAVNTFVSPQLRSTICECTDSAYHFKRPYSLKFAVAFAAGTTPNNRLGTGLCSWDLLRLSKDPGLTSDQAMLICEALTRITARQRVGEDRATAIRDYLVEHFHLTVDSSRWFEPRVLLQLPSAWAPHRPPLLDLDGAVSTVVEASKEKDATPLVAILGEAPTAWIAFMGMLDCATLDTPLRKIAITAARLCNS
jgi:hypothetical protein